MRFLVRARPKVYIFKVIVFALESEGAGLGPCPDDQIMGLVKAGMTKRWVGTHRIELAANAAHHAANNAPASDAVEHGMFFRERQRMLTDTKRAADNGDLNPIGIARKCRGGHDWRRHNAIGVLMVLVDTESVEAEFLTVFELIKITIIELASLLRVEIAIGKYNPCRSIFLIVV